MSVGGFRLDISGLEEEDSPLNGEPFDMLKVCLDRLCGMCVCVSPCGSLISRFMGGGWDSIGRGN